MNITGNVEFLSLEKSAKFWAQRVLDIVNNFSRKDMTEAVRLAGYDIKETAKWLQKFYLEKYK